MAVHVVGYRAAQAPMDERITIVGTLAANESITIKSELDGVVEQISFEEGQAVEAGTRLISIDETKLAASLAEAEANLKLADATSQRYAALMESRAVAQQEADQALATYEARKAGVDLLRAQLQDATVTAPFSGVIGERLVSMGQFVTKGQNLTSLIDADTMKAEFNVPERFVGQLSQGQEIQARVAAYPDERFLGTVYFIDPQVNLETRTVLVKARLPNPDGKLRAGMFTNLNVIFHVREQAVVIPESALLLEGSRTSVFIAQDSTAQLRSVTTGVRLAGILEILEGLAPGEIVIIEGTQKLSPGAPVEVRLDERPVDEIARGLAGSPAVVMGR
jgi:membrane fusion protein (multidrug efflux system)